MRTKVYRLSEEVLETPEQVIQTICGLQPEPYLIKVKCMACTECPFRPYAVPIVSGSKLIIGDYTYPFNLIEKITVRVREDDSLDEYVKVERKYKVSRGFLDAMFSEEAREERRKFQE